MLGTWVPLERGVELAELYEVDSLLGPILHFVEGDKSPPIAPKHTTAATIRAKRARETRPPSSYTGLIRDHGAFESCEKSTTAQGEKAETGSTDRRKIGTTVKERALHKKLAKERVARGGKGGSR
ncbi:hypothetical protein G6F68_015499 [Rhizopus microsporus]|nr:hypothetical protein G6F68_015499 [Rhizopus microsporus]